MSRLCEDCGGQAAEHESGKDCDADERIRKAAAAREADAAAADREREQNALDRHIDQKTEEGMGK